MPIAHRGSQLAAFLLASSLIACSTPVSSATPTASGFLPAVRNAPANTATSAPTAQPSKTSVPATAQRAPSATAPAQSATSAPSRTPTRPAASTTPSATLLPTVLSTVSPAPGGIAETFEGDASTWQVQREGDVTRSTAQHAGGSSAALARGSGSARAVVRTGFSDAASSHQYEERPGTFRWQRAQIFVPASTINQLGGGALTIAGFSASGGGPSWSLRVKASGALAVYGFDSDGNPAEVNASGTFPLDTWVSLEIGLHSQLGPGVKRAFAFVVNGDFYGWYRQGRMTDETYDRAEFGVLAAGAGPAEVYIDQWGSAGTDRFPTGADNRSTANLQEQNFRSGSGVQVQYDWSTWKYKPTLDAAAGLYTPDNRLQAGRNIDRMPDLRNGWAEIEISWPKGAQPPAPGGEYFGPMVGFRKEVNREENLEIIPYRDPADGKLYLVFEVWNGDGAVIKARWPMPDGAVPGDGDIIRARWEETGGTNLRVRASYYDASRTAWNTNIIDWSGDLGAVPDPRPAPGGPNTINFFDGFHAASSITIDSTAYGIKRFKLGTLATYPAP